MTRGVRGLAAPIAAGATGTAIFATGVWLLAGHMQSAAITADWGWLYRAGQTIRAHGLPNHDLFSWTFPDRHWVLYQWLFEVIAAPIYNGLGLAASVFSVGLLAIVTYALMPALILRREGVHPIWPMLVGALVLIPVSSNLGLRPMLASNFALLAQYALINRLRAGHASLAGTALATALIYALWSNMHLGFTLGLFSLVLFAVGDLWTRVRGRVSHAFAPHGYAVLLGVAVLASGLNPYGWTLYAYIVHLSLETRMNAHIHELMPPRLANIDMQIGALLLVVFAGLALIFRRVLSAAELLHVTAFAALAFTAMRFVIWAGLFYALVGPRLFDHAATRLAPAALRRALTPLDAPGARRAMVAVLCLVGIAVVTLGAPATAGSARLAGCAPLRESLLYLDRHYPPGTHWFSSETAGSCARFFTPARRVFIDTRFDMYPEPFVMAWFGAYQHRRHWQRLFERWDINVVLLPRGAPLIEPLQRDPAWRLAHRDAGALVFTRRAPVSDTGRTALRSAD